MADSPKAAAIRTTMDKPRNVLPGGEASKNPNKIVHQADEKTPILNKKVDPMTFIYLPNIGAVIKIIN